ncbi:MAG: patatin-like phospholipase family protein [Candidatus Omnitrophica bacterium]|nr:patatin-like phospholipase family protein [Candidatus Omnitrophota bacterium]MDD5653133.1 patatin-like phospholipase family protein [Candidatus Omnitrophota bacterium]
MEKDLILQEIPLFMALNRKEKALLLQKSRIVEYKKGQIVYEEGAPPDAFYCLILGRILIYTKDLNGNEKPLEYLHRGKYFGIISLLTGEPHSVSAKAINDCALLVISKADFDLIIKQVPVLAVDLSRTLCRRLKNKDLHQKSIFESTIFSVYSSYSHAGKTIYALNLALSLKKETRKSVIVLDIASGEKIHSLPKKLEIDDSPKVFALEDKAKSDVREAKNYILASKFGVDLFCLNYQAEDDACRKKLNAILSNLVNDYHYIILDLPAAMDNFVFSVLNQSDFIHLLSSPECIDLKRTHHLVERLKAEFNFPETKIKIIINEYKLSKISCVEQKEFLGSAIFATLPKMGLVAKDRLVLEDADSEYAKAIRRISRQASDSCVGLALGVGMGYGFCHIGVLKVIEEQKIPIDVISGASIGAIIASLWATGRSSAEIMEITREFREPKFMWSLADFTFPSLGFIKGNKMYHFLKKYLGDKTFYDVRLPLKVVASDVRKKESKIFDEGPLVEALMASCAMPGVFRPFSFAQGLLLDGGIITPLPTEILFKMGVRKIIAVNVTPCRSDIVSQYEKIKEQLSVTYEAVKKREWFNLKKYLKERFKTNILDIIFSSIEVMQAELVEKEVQLADVVLHPDTSGMHWLELHRSSEFARRGEEEARKNLDKIWQVINE